MVNHVTKHNMTNRLNYKKPIHQIELAFCLLLLTIFRSLLYTIRFYYKLN